MIHRTHPRFEIERSAQFAHEYPITFNEVKELKYLTVMALALLAVTATIPAVATYRINHDTVGNRTDDWSAWDIVGDEPAGCLWRYSTVRSSHQAKIELTGGPAGKVRWYDVYGDNKKETWSTLYDLNGKSTFVTWDIMHVREVALSPNHR